MVITNKKCEKVPLKITTNKGIDCIYKYDKGNWSNPTTNTIFVMPTSFDTSIQTQCNSKFDASVGTNDVASAKLYQSINHCGKTYGKDNDYSQSHETPKNHHHNHTMIVHPAFTWKIISFFSN